MAILGAILATAPAQASLTEIQWDASGRSTHTLAVPAGKVAELCGALTLGQSISWSYRVDRTARFNIHFHQGEQVVYVAQQEGPGEGKGSFVVALKQDYCWMWTNPSSQPLQVQVTLQR